MKLHLQLILSENMTQFFGNDTKSNRSIGNVLWNSLLHRALNGANHRTILAKVVHNKWPPYAENRRRCSQWSELDAGMENRKQ